MTSTRRRGPGGVAIALAALVLSTAPAPALTLTGNAEVIDSDVVKLDGYTLFLHGLESLESDQVCAIGDDIWECYPAAVRALQTIVSEGEITCDVVSGPNFLDQAIARCMRNGEDIGERYVRAGFAVTIPAETAIYEDAMKAAQDEGAGLWKGRFFMPAVWRQSTGIFSDRPTYRPVEPQP